MFPEYFSQDYRVLATAERACSVLEESIKVGGTYWVPYRYEGNRISYADLGTFYVVFTPLPSPREVDIYIGAKVLSMKAGIDHGKPVVLVELKDTNTLPYAIQFDYRQPLLFGFLNEGKIVCFPQLRLHEFLQNIPTAPHFVTTHRQFFTFIPQDVRVIYTFQRQS